MYVFIKSPAQSQYLKNKNWPRIEEWCGFRRFRAVMGIVLADIYLRPETEIVRVVQDGRSAPLFNGVP